MIRVVLDTNLYIGWLVRGRHADLMVGPGFVRHLSAVVVMELRAGATTPSARRALERMLRAYRAAGRLLSPPAALFEDAGAVLQALRVAGREVRRASLVHDVLIALSARAIGATLYTSDRADFEAIRSVRRFELKVVA